GGPPGRSARSRLGWRRGRVRGRPGGPVGRSSGRSRPAARPRRRLRELTVQSFGTSGPEDLVQLALDLLVPDRPGPDEHLPPRGVEEDRDRLPRQSEASFDGGGVVEDARVAPPE